MTHVLHLPALQRPSSAQVFTVAPAQQQAAQPADLLGRTQAVLDRTDISARVKQTLIYLLGEEDRLANEGRPVNLPHPPGCAEPAPDGREPCRACGWVPPHRRSVIGMVIRASAVKLAIRRGQPEPPPLPRTQVTEMVVAARVTTYE